MADAPILPETAPLELREFVACKRASVTLSSGDLTWLPLPPEVRDFAPTPTLELEPGPTPGTGTIKLALGPFVSVSIDVSIADGQLRMDAAGAGSAIPGAQEAIDTWVGAFNAWLHANGNRLKDTAVAGGSVTLTKEPIPAAAPPTATTPGGGSGPIQPPKPIPPPAPPPADQPKSGCFLLGLLGLALVGGVGIGVATGFLKLPGGEVEPSASPSSAVVSPAPSASPRRSPSVAPSVAASATPSVGPSAATEPPPGTAPAVAFLEEYGIWPGDDVLDWYLDESDDWFLPMPGGRPVQQPSEIDHRAATGFKITIDTETAAGLTEALPCEEETVGPDGSVGPDGTTYRSGCNQPRPIVAGFYDVLVTTFGGPYPDDVPPAGLHSWSVFTNIDDDLTTGFTSPSTDNYLIGADIYFELVAFESNAGGFRYYILATRLDDPVRPDTGQTQGNLPTIARVAWFHETGTMVWIIPGDDFGGVWSAGAFATTDRGANGPETLAADALGGPASEQSVSFVTSLWMDQ